MSAVPFNKKIYNENGRGLSHVTHFGMARYAVNIACVTELPVFYMNSVDFVAPCGLRGCKNWPAPFPGRMSYKVT